MYNNTNGFAVGYLSGTGGVILRYEASAAALNEQNTLNIHAWPNPAHDQLFIEWPLGLDLPYQLTDAQGRIISSGRFTDTASALNTGALSPGIYFIHIADAGYAPIRFIKD